MFRYLVHVVLVAVAFTSITAGIWTDDLLKGSLIIGGESTTIEDYPYMANVLVNGGHLCGGSIISDRWIITAAHCVLNTSNEYTVRLGSTFNDFGGTVYSLDTIIIHENFRENNFTIPYEDIAVLKVSTPITFDKTRQPISLFNTGEEAEPGVDAVVNGWGVLKENDTKDSAILQTVTLSIVSKAQCNMSYAESGGIPYGQICAAYSKGGKDACNNDAGGPLVIKGRLAGIVSWGNGCGDPECPGVYIEIAWYREWVKEKTGV